MTTISHIIQRIVEEAAERLEYEHMDSSFDFYSELEKNNYFNHRTELIKDGNRYRCSNCNQGRYIVDCKLPNYCDHCGFEFLNVKELDF